jgi:archaellum component FlaG (FlaF/FlaG flagellin family)
MMMFFAFLIIVTTLVVLQTNLIESQAVASEEQDRMASLMNTKIEILNISFDNATDPDTTTIYVKNIGAEKLDTGTLDLYIDEVRVPRDGNNRTLTLVKNGINPLHWDPDEVVRAEIYLDLDNVTHLAVVSTEVGIRDATTYLG